MDFPPFESESRLRSRLWSANRHPRCVDCRRRCRPTLGLATRAFGARRQRRTCRPYPNGSCKLRTADRARSAVIALTTRPTRSREQRIGRERNERSRRGQVKRRARIHKVLKRARGSSVRRRSIASATRLPTSGGSSSLCPPIRAHGTTGRPLAPRRLDGRRVFDFLHAQGVRPAACRCLPSGAIGCPAADDSPEPTDSAPRLAYRSSSGTGTCGRLGATAALRAR